MHRILVIDDDRVVLKIITTALGEQSYEVYTASNGREGLRVARAKNPDAVITDIMMPEMNGIEFARRLRQDVRFANTPILVLTTQSDLEDKLNAFDAGADDYLRKPFETAELLARMAVLLRRADALKIAQISQTSRDENARVIAVHSLRGGIGCSSVAANLAIGLAAVWEKPTLLLDMNMTVGQIGLMLNKPQKRTWADLARYEQAEIDAHAVKSLIGRHESGLHYILAPPAPADAEKLEEGLLSTAVSLLPPEFDYIVADLPHNFSEAALSVLDIADTIVLLVAPELAAVRAAAVALNTYKQLDYNRERIKLVMNWTFERNGLSQEKIANALKYPLSLVLPFAPDQFIQAVNHGAPLLHHQPNDPVSALLEDFAFRLSKPAHQKEPPSAPSEAWQRVTARLRQTAKDKKEKPKERKRWSFPLKAGDASRAA
ncbi:MAG: response regulator [Chloroflexi bacterium]|nr:response regulator [Chloroflexota bacterium]